MVFINELYLVHSILKVTGTVAGPIGNKKLVKRWELMNRKLMVT